MEWMIMPYKRYADFSGRSRRKEYWMFQLFVIIVYVVLLMLGGGLGAAAGDSGGGLAGGLFGILLLVFIVATFIPALAVLVRRLHDQDKSGWWALLALVPIASLVLLVFMFLDGTPGDNQYGPDPKGNDSQAFE
ncbi:MAG: DUF805 domain-containing protein [Sphingomonadales bacterium]|nr:DUF805 domain-containing protein [Sphingomonadales bacterium]MBD3772521.1 DUF805 domain-containing protein [Paracoccaceae bacterium]MBD3813895.1 DUF805 domain-containing protein [Betaproteobacteria bacterium]